MIDEGVIKFNCKWTKTEPIAFDGFEALNSWREKLFGLGLIGVYPDGIGFGNISIHAGGNKGFIISGTQTGRLSKPGREHYTRVVDYSIEKNQVVCEGPVKASSESLTHAMIYKLDSAIRAVIHVHSKKLWEKIKYKIATTGDKIPYGTPEMALEVKRLYENTDLPKQKIIAMAGHEEGIITFGASMEEAGNTLLAHV